MREIRKQYNKAKQSLSVSQFHHFRESNVLFADEWQCFGVIQAEITLQSRH